MTAVEVEVVQVEVVQDEVTQTLIQNSFELKVKLFGRVVFIAKVQLRHN
jgi:hypothetical protein